MAAPKEKMPPSEPTSQYPRAAGPTGNDWVLPVAAEVVRALCHAGRERAAPRSPTNLTVYPSAPTVQTAVEMEATEVVPSPVVDTEAVKPANSTAFGRKVGDSQRRGRGPPDAERLRVPLTRCR